MTWTQEAGLAVWGRRRGWPIGPPCVPIASVRLIRQFDAPPGCGIDDALRLVSMQRAIRVLQEKRSFWVAFPAGAPFLMDVARSSQEASS